MVGSLQHQSTALCLLQSAAVWDAATCAVVCRQHVLSWWCGVYQLLQDFESFVNTSTPRDKAADLVVLEGALQEAHPSLPDLVRR